MNVDQELKCSFEVFDSPKKKKLSKKPSSKKL